MSASAAIAAQRPGNGRRMLLLVAALLALPFLVGGGLFVAGWQPARTVNHGRLLTPPVPLPATGLVAADGRPLPTADLAGRWLLLLPVGDSCNAACLARIDEMRRIHVSLYKNMPRLRRVVLATGIDPALASLAGSQPDLVVASAPRAWLPVAPPGASALHVVDPQGRLVMEYAPDTDARAVRSDLERLLKFAWNG
ncbi:MAG: hypothetical protein FIB06_02530 [Betaproteobacteria bacterium]|nr:hypothetical protein [Betaproteobacteria bacterium]